MNFKNFFSGINVKITVQTIDHPPSQLVHLNLTDNLSKIRKELEIVNIINDTLSFLNYKFAEVPLENEKDFLLNEIINESENILYLKCSRSNWKYMKESRQLEFGCTMTFDGIKKANKKASIMKDCKLSEFGAEGCQIGDVEFNSVEDRLMKTNLFFNTDINIKNFVELGISNGTSKNEKFKSETNKSYHFMMYSKVSLKFSEHLEASTEFIKVVEDALESKDTERFKQITEEFGQFIPTEVVMGGRAHFDDIKILTERSTEDENKVSMKVNTTVQKTNIESGSNYTKEKSNFYKFKCKKLIGGEQPDSLKNFDEKAWIKSLKDYRRWDSIEFRNPISIFQILPDDLRKRIIEFVGKRIHYLRFEDFDYQLEEVGVPTIFELKEMPSNISKMIQSKDANCNIFATVNDTKESKDAFFTLQILCPSDGKPRPSLIIHCVQKKFRKRKYRLKIGWMVIGYYTDLTFILSDFNAQLNILEKKFDTLNNQTMFRRELLSFEYNSLIRKFPSCLGIPVLSKLDTSNNSLVIGHHFFNPREENKIGACTFSYCIKNKHYVDLPKFTFCTLIISNYPISNAFGTISFNQSFIKKLYFSKACLNTKYISLFSTEKTNCGPIFLKQKSGRIKIKYINCKCKTCFICKNKGLKIPENNIGCVYFVPTDVSVNISNHLNRVGN